MLTADERAELEELIDLAVENMRSDWEHEFVRSIEDQFDNPFWEPSEKQREKLRQIAERDEDDLMTFIRNARSETEW
jgi:hypothetical protein